jgi:hypothetical protein
VPGYTLSDGGAIGGGSVRGAGAGSVQDGAAGGGDVGHYYHGGGRYWRGRCGLMEWVPAGGRTVYARALGLGVLTGLACGLREQPDVQGACVYRKQCAVVVELPGEVVTLCCQTARPCAKQVRPCRAIDACGPRRNRMYSAAGSGEGTRLADDDAVIDALAAD